MTVGETIEFLLERKKTMRTSELRGALEALGFRVRDCKRGGHKTVSHPNLVGFFGGSFNGGHGADGEVKAPYVMSMVRILKIYQQELDQLLEKRS